MKADLSFVVRRGKEPAAVLKPHRHKDGKYVASMSRFERDYIRVETLRELAILLRHGFSIRMSAPGRAPSLVSPASIKVA